MRGKGGRGGQQAGWSAAAEFRRARRAHAWHRLLRATALGSASGLAVGAVVTGDVRLIVGAVVAAVAGWRCRPDRDPERWARGAEAEVATARLLADLPKSYVVLHDRALPGQPGNIDHLVIGPSGVWVVDTKLRRAPLRVRRRQVWAGDHVIDPRSAAWQAEVVSRELATPVAAVIAVHGAGLRRRGTVVSGVRILPARRLSRRLRRGRRLPRADVARLARRADQWFAPRC